jgi:uncharacterized protein YeaO (DUF488 family)
MSIRIIRLGIPRVPHEGPRLGTVRRPPRGVRRDDIARRNYYDVWFPELAPSAALLTFANAEPLSAARWRTFSRRYLAELRAPAAARMIALLTELSYQANFSVGCYCEDESRCHRSLLRDVLANAGAVIAD